MEERWMEVRFPKEKQYQGEAERQGGMRSRIRKEKWESLNHRTLDDSQSVTGGVKVREK